MVRVERSLFNLEKDLYHHRDCIRKLRHLLAQASKKEMRKMNRGQFPAAEKVRRQIERWEELVRWHQTRMEHLAAHISQRTGRPVEDILAQAAP
jgi:hypothetical protein